MNVYGNPQVDAEHWKGTARAKCQPDRRFPLLVHAVDNPALLVIVLSTFLGSIPDLRLLTSVVDEDLMRLEMAEAASRGEVSEAQSLTASPPTWEEALPIIQKHAPKLASDLKPYFAD